MGMSGISKSQVSRLCQDIDQRVGRFLERPLSGQWPYLWLDATYLKSREDGHVVNRALVVAVGVNTEGRREVLGTRPVTRRRRRRSGCSFCAPWQLVG